MKGYNSYFDRVSFPGKKLIDFMEISHNPNYINEIWLSYKFNVAFKQEVDLLRACNDNFNNSFEKYFGKRLEVQKKKTYSKK